MSVNQDGQTRFVYFDQNVLLDMAYGHLQPLRERLFQQLGCRLIYSTENMEELHRLPVEHHQPTLAFLSEAKAACARMSVDLKTVSVDLEVDPAAAFTAHCEAVASFSDLDYSMHGFMLKLFGGGHTESRQDIARKQKDEIWAMLDHGLRQLDSLHDVPAADRAAMRAELEAQKLRVAGGAMELARQMDEAEALHGTITAQQMYQISPDEIEPPNVLLQVWDQVRNIFEPKGISLDQLLGFTPASGLGLEGGNLTLVQKVNAIYGLLNLLGYYRDGGVTKIRGLKRSSSDATHVGYAVCATIFVCRDERLVKKAVAAYEYVGVRTPIVLEIKGDPRKDQKSVRWAWAWPRLDRHF
jgi:hypothetical protein